VKTPVVARLVKTTRANISRMIADGKIPAPEYRDSSGHFWWTEAEIQGVLLALKNDLRKRPRAVAV
jgi:hypothetical protein